VWRASKSLVCYLNRCSTAQPLNRSTAQPLNRYSIRHRASSDAALSLSAGAADVLRDVSDTTVENIIGSASTKACSPAELKYFNDVNKGERATVAAKQHEWELALCP
jgi:hypothetical protein